MSAERAVRVVLPTGFGVNCEAETARAFRLAGAEVEPLHLNDLIARPDRLASAQILALAGGFSFGDHLGAGRALANRLRCRLRSELDRFIGDGGLVIGICNGFQTMVRLGLLPDGRPGRQRVALAPNAHGAFYDGWVTLRVDERSRCLWTRGLSELELPVRHGEGRLVVPAEVEGLVADHHLVPMRYWDRTSRQPAVAFAENPNGSADGRAALCDSGGRLFGLMPHPEAFTYRENHPRWRSASYSGPTGLAIFANGVAAARGR